MSEEMYAEKAIKAGLERDDRAFVSDVSLYDEEYYTEDGIRVTKELVQVLTKEEVIENGKKKTVTLPKWTLKETVWNEEKYYENSPWVFRCTDIKAKAIAKITWSLYPDETGESEALGEDNDMYRVLTDVNPEANWHDLISTLSKDLDLYGMAYIKKIRTPDDKVIFIQRLNPVTMSMKADRDGIGYFIQSVGGSQTDIAREDIIYLHDYHPTNDFGSTSPLRACRDSADVEIEANKHLASFFKNRAMPAYIFTSEQAVNETDHNRIVGSFARNFKGSSKQFKTGFMSHGYKPMPLGYAPKDLVLKEVREESRRAICGAFGVSATLAGAWEAANYATMDVQRKSLYTETVIPRSDYIAGVFNAELSIEFDDIPFFVFEPEKLDVMQEDTAQMATWLGEMVEKKVIKPEVAALALGFNKDDVPEPVANPFLDMTPVEDDDEEKEEVVADQDTKTVNVENEYNEDLRKYRTVSIKRMKDAKSAKKFTSDYIPQSELDVFYGKLQLCNTVDDVIGVFN